MYILSLRRQKALLKIKSLEYYNYQVKKTLKHKRGNKIGQERKETDSCRLRQGQSMILENLHFDLWVLVEAILCSCISSEGLGWKLSISCNCLLGLKVFS